MPSKTKVEMAHRGRGAGMTAPAVTERSRYAVYWITITNGNGSSITNTYRVPCGPFSEDQAVAIAQERFYEVHGMPGLLCPFSFSLIRTES